MSYSNSRDYDAAKARRIASIGGCNQKLIDDVEAKKSAKDAARSAAYLAARAAGLSMDDASEIDAVYDSNGDCSAHEAEKYGY